MTIDDAIVASQTDFDSRIALPDPYDCVTLVDPTSGDSGCRDFQITVEGSDPAGENKFWDGYRLEILWGLNTNLTFPNGPDNFNGQVRVLQNPSTVPGNAYTIDMCLAYGCEYLPEPFPIDPGIRSRDTDFSSMIVAWTPVEVPEPSTLLLLGLGVGSGLLRKYRWRGPAAADRTR